MSRPKSYGKHRPERILLKGEHLSRHGLESICSILEGAGIVLIPTDTGFCYIGDPHQISVHKSFLRLRSAHPKHKPFSLLVRDLAVAASIATVATPQYRVLKKLLPGPFTVVLSKNKRTPDTATSQKGTTVGVRIPNVIHLAELLEAYDRPLLVTSVTDAEELIREQYFGAKQNSPDAWWAYAEEIVSRHGHELSAFIDPEEPQPMRASTIFDLTQEPPLMVRDGGWDISDLTFDFLRKSESEA